MPLRLCLIALVLICLATDSLAQSQTQRSVPVPFHTLTEQGDDATLVASFYFADLQQGSVGLMQVDDAEERFIQVRALFRERDYDFIRDGDAWYGLLVADIDAQPRDYPLAVVAVTPSGELISIQTNLTITSGGFFRETFSVPATRAFLIDPAIERQEFARLGALMAQPLAPRKWDDSGFGLPIDAPITSAFGQYRVLNDSVLTRHTGWDQSAPVGTPVYAIAGGEVVYAGRLDIRGNYVLIHHGWGIYSGYAHFSQLNVQVGQRVQGGQLIGASGNTGRSSGPHLHWEIAIQGEWIDGLAFINLWLPHDETP